MPSARHLVQFIRDPNVEGTMRILFATNMWPDDARPYYGSFVASQAESLRGTGIAVDALYVRGYEARSAYLRGLFAVPVRAAMGHYNLVHAHFGHTLATSIMVRDLPLVASYCGEDLLGAPRADTITKKSRIEVAVFRQLARRATLTVTKSQQMEAVLPPSLQLRNRILPNGVDTERFRWRDKTAAREQVGWPPGGKIMLFLGNPDDPRKNSSLARTAAYLVAESDPSARLEIVWQAPADRVPIYLNAADVLVFPSLSEGSPNAVKEAMASELPIVATPVGDVPERFASVDGCFVSAPDPAEFAIAIRRALEIGRNPASRRAIQPLGAARIARRLTDIYEEARNAYTAGWPSVKP